MPGWRFVALSLALVAGCAEDPKAPAGVDASSRVDARSDTGAASDVKSGSDANAPPDVVSDGGSVALDAMELADASVIDASDANGATDTSADDRATDDVTTTDGTALDVNAMEAAIPDANAADVSVPDAPVVDVNAPDGARADASAVDTGVVDAGVADVARDTGSDLGGALPTTDVPRFDGAPVEPYTEPPTPYGPATVTVPPLPTFDLTGLPTNDAGLPILSRSSAAELVLVRPASPDALHALARCGVLVTHCVQPRARSLDACFASVRRCSTATPWTEEPCCPGACIDAYAAQRTAGYPPMRSFERAMFSRPSCVPGVDALLGRM